MGPSNLTEPVRPSFGKDGTCNPSGTVNFTHTVGGILMADEWTNWTTLAYTHTGSATNAWVVAPNSMPFSTGAATLGMGSFTGTPNIVPGDVTALVLAVNPSVTGTVYQNVCGYGVWICFPVTTAGTVTVHTGPYSAATNELWYNATAVALNGQIMFYVAQNCYWKITLGGAAALSAGDCQCPTDKKWKPEPQDGPI